MRRLDGVVLAVLATTTLLLGGSSSAEANFVAAASDPTGDAADPSPGRDILAAALSYDPRTGELRGGVRLRAAPSSSERALLTLFAGIRTASGCNGYPAIGFATDSDDWAVDWLRFDAPGQPAAAKGDTGKVGDRPDVQEFAAEDAQLAHQSPNCVIATLSEPGNPANVYDEVGPLTLEGQPALELTVGSRPTVLRAGQTRALTVRIDNMGDAPTGPIRVSASRARGLTVRGTGRVRSLRPGERATMRLAVSLSARAADRTRLRISAAAGRLSTRGEAELHLLRAGHRRPADGGFTPQSCNRWQPDLSGQTGGSLVLVAC